MHSSEKARQALNRIMEKFLSGGIPKLIARTLIRPIGGQRPSDSWSFCNQLLMILAGTDDARGYRQWQEAGRYVKRGAQALYILAPLICIKEAAQEVKEDDSLVQEKNRFLVGFRVVPVFRIEDTEGPEVNYSPPDKRLPPLLEVAQRWNLSVHYRPGNPNDSTYGFHVPGSKIVLMTEEEGTFFHELAHAAHHRVDPKANDRAEGELIAELTAITLCELYQRDMGRIGYSYNYLEGWANGDWKRIIGILNTVKSCLDEILNDAHIDGYGGQD